MTFDPSNASHVKSRNRRERRAAERRRNVVAKVLSTKDGRDLVRWLLDQDFVFRAVTPGEWADFNNGQRNSGLRLLNLCNEADPEWLSKAMKEAQDATKADEAEETAAGDTPEEGGTNG